MAFNIGDVLTGKPLIEEQAASVSTSFDQLSDSTGDFLRSSLRGDIVGASEDLFSISTETTNILGLGTQNITFDAFRKFTQPEVPNVDYEDRKNQITSASAPRRMVYGEARTGGVVRYAESSGDNDKFLHLISVFAAHTCDAVSEIYFDGELAFIGTVAQGKFVGKATCIIETGKQTTANAAIVADTPARWTDDHKLLGQTYAYFKLEYSNDVFRSVPTITATLRGKDDIYDPRTGQSGWSDNLALCVMDYIQSRYGYRSPQSEINLESFIDGANDCDDLVASGVGITEKRYTCNGTISIIDDPVGPLENMLLAGSAGLQYVQGQFRYISGVYKAPVSQNSLGESQYTFDSTTSFTFDSTIAPTFDSGYGINYKFTDSDLIGGISYTPSGDADSRVNATRGTYIDPNQDYEPVDFVQLNIPAYEAQDKEILYADTKFQFVDSGTRARRLSKIFLERTRYGVRLSVKFKVRALEFGVGDRIEFESESEGLTNKVYRIDEITPSIDGADVSLSEDDPLVWSWAEGDALPVIAPPALNLPDPQVVVAPTGLSVSEEVYFAADNTSVKSRLTIIWDNDDVIERWEVQGSLDSGPYVDLTTFTSTNSFVLDNAGLGNWSFSVLAVNGIGKKSPYSTPFAFTAQGKTDVPANIAGFTGTRRTNGVEINWNEAAEQDISYYEIRNGASWAAGTPIRQADSNGFLWEPENQTVSTLYIKAFDKSGNESAVATSLTVGTGATAVTSDTGPIQNNKTSFTDDTDGYFLGAGQFYVGNLTNLLKFDSIDGLKVVTDELTINNGSVSFSGTISTSNNRFKVNASSDIGGSVAEIDTGSGASGGITVISDTGDAVNAGSLAGRAVDAASAVTGDYSSSFSSTGAGNLGVLFQTTGANSPQAASFFGLKSGIMVSTSSSGAAGDAAIIATSPSGAAHIQMLTEHTVFPVASDGAIILGKNGGGTDNIYVKVDGFWRKLSWTGAAADGAAVF